MELYKPLGSLRLSEVKEIPQLRVGIQGFGGTGKTWSALTFPNPVVLNLDRGLGAHVGRNDVVELPFYRDDFCKTIIPSFKRSDLKDAILKWLQTSGMKMSPEQTLVFDSNTSLQNAYHTWFKEHEYELASTKSGQLDGFVEWKTKKQYYSEVMEYLKAIPCHVVFICHEAEATVGKHTGKLRPLLTGQFADELMIHFTDFFRQIATEKPTDFSKIEKPTLDNWGMKNIAEFKAMCDTFPRKTIYYWTTEGDAVFDGKCSSLVNYPHFMPANHSSFQQYKRK